MLTTDLAKDQITPKEVIVNTEDNVVIIVMPLLPDTCKTVSGKMNAICASNGFLNTEIVDPRTGKNITVQVFLGTKA